jgi:hypothetical protein
MRRFQVVHGGGETPVPIPNTAVKPSCADGTCLVRGRESRSPPGLSFVIRDAARHSPGRFCFHGRPAQEAQLQRSQSGAEVEGQSPGRQ